MRKRVFASLLVIALAGSLAGGVAAAGKRKKFDPGAQAVPCVTPGTVSTIQRMWPPNHKLQSVALAFEDADNDGDTLTLTVNSITHEEEGFEKGSTKKHEPDFVLPLVPTDTGVDTLPPAAADPATVVVQLRRERNSKPKNGRTYTINVTCTDAGDVSLTPPTTETVDVNVVVLHSRGKKYRS